MHPMQHRSLLHPQRYQRQCAEKPLTGIRPVEKFTDKTFARHPEQNRAAKALKFRQPSKNFQVARHALAETDAA